MKVVCEGCSTKYSIEDDKVVGRVFKLRCRKCAHVIVARAGTLLPEAFAPDPAPVSVSAAGSGPASVAGSAPEWHAVRNGQQIGPFDSRELLRRRAAGELDDGSYIWREGFAEWQPLGSVDELRALAASAPVTAAVAPVRVLAPVAATPAHGVEVAKLHGERHETSLLFSLNGLSKQAVPSGAARAVAGVATVASAAAGASGATGGGGARGEGSGLIDIRGLARSYASATRPTEARVGVAPASRIGSMDDLPAFPSGAFLAPSVLVPQSPPRRDHRLVVGLAAAFGLLAICATLVVVIVLSRRGQAEVATGTLAPVAPRVAKIDPPFAPRTASPAVVEPPAVPSSAPAPSAPAVAAVAPSPTPSPSVRPPAAPSSPSVRTPSSPATPTRTPATPTRTPGTQVRTPATPPSAPTPPPAPTPKCDQVTCVVNGFDSECCRALQGGGLLGGKSDPAPTHSTLPDSLDRAAITEGLNTIAAKRCGSASAATGMVKARLKVSATGTVTSVTVESSPDAALSACLVEQAQRGRFKPTQRGGSFSYVWRF